MKKKDETKEVRYIPKEWVDKYIKQGWTIRDLGYPHNKYSVLAVREV